MISRVFLYMVVLISFVLFSCNKESKNSDNEKNTKKQIQTVEVVYQEVPDYIEATGLVQPDKDGTVKITSKLPGIVQSINVQVGDYVKKGQVLASVKAPDTTDLYSQKVALSVQLSQAERIYKLKKELYEVGAIPKAELMDAETNYNVLKAQLKGIEEKMKLLGGTFDSSVITSPIDGIVYQINSHVGDSVDQTTEILSLVNPNKIMVVALVQDKDVFKLKEGDDVDFSIDLFQDKKFQGVVKYISDVVDPDTKKIKVFIEPKEKKALKINMFFNIRIHTGKQSHAVIPQKALIYKDGKFYVYVEENGKLIKKEVKFIKELEDNKVSVDGLNQGEKVVIDPMLEEHT